MNMLWYDPGIYLPANKMKKLRKLENSYAQQLVFMSEANLALQRYHIKGLLPTMSERVVLQSLLWYGSVVFFRMDGNLFALPGVPTGAGYNINGDPGSAWVFSRYNGKMYKEVKLYLPGSEESVFLKELIGSKQEGNPAGVIVWENKMRYPFINAVSYYSSKIADCYRTLDITRYWLKRPLLLSGPEESAEGVKKVIQDLDENPNAVYLSDKLGINKTTQLFNTNANGQNLQDITGLLEWYESKFRELCGIDSNSQIDKKGENLIKDEITVNDQFQALKLDECIKEIQKGLDIVNKFFGLSLTVEKNEIIKDGDNNDDVSGVHKTESGPDNKPE